MVLYFGLGCRCFGFLTRSLSVYDKVGVSFYFVLGGVVCSYLPPTCSRLGTLDMPVDIPVPSSQHCSCRDRDAAFSSGFTRSKTHNNHYT